MDDDWIVEHYPAIHQSAWLLTGDAWEAEDLAQETFVVAIERLASFRGESKRSTWLHGILVRLVRHRQRGHVRMQRRLLQYLRRKPSPIHADPAVQLAHQQWKESIWADVARLPTHQRISLVLRFAEERSLEEISQITDVPVGTVKSRLHHGLKKLADFQEAMPIEKNIVTKPSSESSSVSPITASHQGTVAVTSRLGTKHEQV